MAVSYKVKSPHSVGDSTTHKPIKIAPEEIKSNQIGKPGDNRPNVTSYPYGEWKPVLEKGPYGEVYVVTITSNNTFRELATDFIKPGHGFLSQRDDYEIDGMKRAGEDNPPNNHSLIPRISDIIDKRGIAYIIGPYSRMNFPNPRDTSANVSTHPNYVNAININQEGLYASRTANFERLLRSLNPGGDYHFEAKEWVDFLANKGITYDKAKTAGFKGYGILNDVQKEGFLWGYFPDLGFMVAEGNAHNRIKNQVKGFGLTGLDLRDAIDAFKRADIFHEKGHELGIKGRRRAERLQGLFRAEFYAMMAEKYPKYARIYKALAREGMQYAREFSLENAIEDALTEGFEKKPLDAEQVMRRKAAAEADALELKGKARQLYIRARVYDSLGPLLESEPAYTSEDDNLEGVVRKENIRVVIDEAGNAFPVYNGRRVYGEGDSMPDELIITKKADVKEKNEAYEKRIEKSEYRSMSDTKKDAKESKGKELKPENAEAEMAEAAE